MSEIIDVSMGELYVATAPVILTTSSIGSCVAICLYSSIDHYGAIAHIMLPARTDTSLTITANDYKYADVAMQVMVGELERNGILRSRLIAKIAGGANMFPGVQGRSHKIGEKNVESVKQLLMQYSIRLAAEETGGSSGRALSFDLSNGIVTIKVTI